MRILRAIQRRIQHNSDHNSSNHNNSNKISNGIVDGLSKSNEGHYAPATGIPPNVPGKVEAERPQRKYPSVGDYQDTKALKAALQGDHDTNHATANESGSVHSFEPHYSRPRADSSNGDLLSNSSGRSSCSGDPSLDQPVKWTLPLVDQDTTESQTVEHEFQRLQALQSYFVLDTHGELEFDRITRHTAKLFNVPICLISLVDLGRQRFLSRVGLDATETSRQDAFSAHVILSKHNQLIIPDATKDVRFQNNPLVTDSPKIRFYAGAALTSPEGYQLGSLCIISPQVRPQGLNASELETLHELADMVVSTMVARRNRLLKEEYESRFLQLAQTIMATQSNLQKAESSIQQVVMRQSWSMDSDDVSELSSTVKNLALQSQICAAATRTILQDVLYQEDSAKVHPGKNEEEKEEPANVANDNLPTQDASLGDNNHREEAENAHLFWDNMVEYDKIANPITDMQILFDNLKSLVGQFPHRNMVTMELFKSVPKFIIAEDLLLFRIILNLLTHCIGASNGDACGLRIQNKKASNGTNADELLIHCLQGGPLVLHAEAKELFHNRESVLAQVASMVRALGGQYGLFQGRWERDKPTKKKVDTENRDPATAAASSSSSSSRRKVQSIYWIQIPYELPESNGLGGEGVAVERFRRTQLQVLRPREAGDNNNNGAAPTAGGGTSGGASGVIGGNVLQSDPLLSDPLLQPSSRMDTGVQHGSSHGRATEAFTRQESKAE